MIIATAIAPRAELHKREITLTAWLILLTLDIPPALVSLIFHVNIKSLMADASLSFRSRVWVIMRISHCVARNRA